MIVALPTALRDAAERTIRARHAQPRVHNRPLAPQGFGPVSAMDRLNSGLEPCCGLIIESAKASLWLADRLGQTTSADANITQMLGFTRAEMIGRPMSAFLLAGEPETGWAPFAGSKRRKRRHRRPVVVSPKRRSSLWADTTVKAMLDAGGNVSAVVAILRDVAGLCKARTALSERERQSRLLADAMPHIVFVGDESGSVDYHNRAWYHLTYEQSRGKGWL
jgi:PAS domain S-box-containing protein